MMRCQLWFCSFADSGNGSITNINSITVNFQWRGMVDNGKLGYNKLFRPIILDRDITCV